MDRELFDSDVEVVYLVDRFPGYLNRDGCRGKRGGYDYDGDDDQEGDRDGLSC